MPKVSSAICLFHARFVLGVLVMFSSVIKICNADHVLNRASFIGSRVILRQVSPESEAIYDLIISLYHFCNGDWTKLQHEAKIDDQALQHFLEYATKFLGNTGNYRGFGDSKFIPRCHLETFDALVAKSPEAKKNLDKCKASIYADAKKPTLMHLGFPDAGHLSNYYPGSPDITKQEIEVLGEFLAEKKILPENTRIRKTQNGNFEIPIASGISKPPPEGSDAGQETAWDLEGPLKGKSVELVFGDHIEEMAKIALHMKKAGLSAANDTQKMMMDQYAKSFSTGSLNAFKESQKLWVKDIGPEVESNIGFIESYRDPAGVRSEWEGMVAMVNKERTRAFQKLVDFAPSMIPKLPWPRDFEKDNFVAPDFTSLEVLSFSTSGIPAGINIPNHDDIRQQVGFKNVSLGNVLSAKVPNEPIPFIRADDLSIYQNNRDEAFEVQVGIHELLGHGSGKLLQENAPGEYNFDIKNPPINPLTNNPCTSWYKPGQTWSSVFGSIASSMEENRAELVAMALSCDFEILKIFGFGNGKVDMNNKAGEVLYASYLSMARAGVVALEFWDPKSRKWGQAHMQARYSILRTFLDAGGDFCKLEYSDSEDLSDLTIKLDKSKILSHGRPAVEAYLQKVHIYKATADAEAGKKFYEEMTSVDEWWEAKVRKVVLEKKTPRKVFVQGNTFEEDGKVVLREYEATLEGMVRSFAEREI